MASAQRRLRGEARGALTSDRGVAPRGRLERRGYRPLMIEMLTWGFGLIEGPRPDPDGGLYFSDVTRGGVHHLGADGEVTLAVPKRRGVGGIALHADGGLVLSGRNVCHVRDGVTRILFELPDVGGFNDLYADVAGRVYVGSLRDDPFSDRSERKPGEAYRIDGEGDATEVYGNVGLTNGIGLSPDGRRLYHCDSAAQAVLVHTIDDEGNIDPSSRAVFATVKGGIPDGLAVDTEGGVWVAVYGGSLVERFAPDGTSDRSLPVPAEAVTSLVFAGQDLGDLIV
ncbi:MAG: hypothetical protein EHM63_04045, partial [Actinobacteria bacterium]